MKIKDFKVGQDAWILSEKGNIAKVSISRVGRKYACIQNFGYEKQYRECEWCTEGLVENRDWGMREFLFPTEEKLLEYQERKDIESWLCEKLSRGIANKYSIEQLRSVKEILKGA